MTFEKMVATRYEKEDEADFGSQVGKLSLWLHNPIELEASEMYTRRIYSEFKNKLRGSTGHELIELEDNSSHKITIKQGSTLPYHGIQSYIVIFDQTIERLDCSCKFFVFSSLLRSHVLKVMLHLNIHKIPLHFIMKRWTKDEKKKVFEHEFRKYSNW